MISDSVIREIAAMTIDAKLNVVLLDTAVIITPMESKPQKFVY